MAEAATRPQRRAGSIRVRTTAAAALVVGAALLVAAVAMVVLLQRSLQDDLRTGALIRAEAIGGDLGSGLGSGVITGGDAEEEFAQVLDAGGDVVAASPNLEGRDALVRLSPGQTETVDEVPFEDGPFLVVATAAKTPDGPVTVVVGRALDDIAETSRAVAALLALTIPLLLVVVGVVTWWIVGRALAPVEAVRAEVEAISTEELHRRVPDPPGRDEISRLASTMNRMLARLEEGQRRQRRFVSDASHELRSPIASIRQHAEVALSHPGQTDLLELAEVVLQEDARLQGLVEDLLLLSRIDEGTAQLRFAPVDLDDLVFEEAARLRSSTGLTVDVGGVSAGRVRGDRGRLERLVRNLTDNAGRHARSAIALSLAERDGEVVFAVDDDGRGVDAGQREHIFDRFMRLDEARDRDTGGSGLGLSIVREIAALHRGTVVVGDAALGGARFEVHIPALPD